MINQGEERMRLSVGLFGKNEDNELEDYEQLGLGGIIDGPGGTDFGEFVQVKIDEIK